MRELRPVGGILIFAISYTASLLVSAGIGHFVSLRENALVSTLVLFFAGYFLLRPAVGEPLRYVGFRRPSPRLVCLAVLASLALLVPVMSLEAVTLVRFKVPQELVDALNEVVKAKTVPELVYVLVVAALVAAVGEEFVFRGILQRGLTSGFGPWVGILLASTVFALLHTIWRTPPALVLGVFLGLLYWRTRSLVLPMVSHFTVNTVAVLSVFVTEKRGEGAMPAWVREDKAAPVWIILGSLAIFVVLLWALWKGTAEESPAAPEAAAAGPGTLEAAPAAPPAPDGEFPDIPLE